jgi:hypothetical protein
MSTFSTGNVTSSTLPLIKVITDEEKELIEVKARKRKGNKGDQLPCSKPLSLIICLAC